MTKRIIAVVLALALCLTMLSVQAFAIDTWTITPSVTDVANSTNKTVSFTWTAPDGGADYYTVTIANGTSTVVNSARVTTTTYSYTATVSGDYKIVVRAYKNSSSIEVAIYQGTANVFIAQSSNGSGGLKVSSVDSNTTKVEWNAQPGNPSYYVAYTLSDGKVGGVEAASNSCTLNFAYSNLRSITVYQGTASSHSTSALASWTNNGSAGTGTGGGYGTGGVSLSGGTLYWNNISTTGYRVSYLLGTSTTPAYINNNGGYVSTNSVDVSSIINRYGYYYNITFIVATTTGQSVGSYYYTASGNGAGVYNLYVTPSYTGTASASWGAYSGADRYLVTATVNGVTTYTQTVYTTSDTNIRYTFGQVTTITVQAAYGGQLLGTVGTATINANGQVSYSGNNNSQAGWWGGSAGNNGNVFSGYNCLLTVNATTSTLQWNSTSAGPYTVVVIPESGNVQLLNAGNATYVTLPYGNAVSFQVIVYVTDTRATVASVTYTASTHNTNSNVKSSIKDLTVTNSTSTSTTISWTAVPGALYYVIEHGALNSLYYTPDQSTTSTSFTLPYGKNTGFEAYVYAYVGTVRKAVGSIVHVAGDEFTTSTNDKKDDNNKTDTTKPADTTPAYVTGFKGTVGTSGSITLAWNAASGKPTYEVYYKKTSSSTWKKLYSTTARSLKVNGLTNNTSYDFKVVANGKDSGILTMTIGTTSSTKTAADPNATSSASAPSLNSVNGGKGTITASWTSVSGANLYRVYIAEDNSTNYKTKTSTWSTSGTSITLSGVSKGTYKVRVKASTDNGKTWTNLADCDYLTVTVQ